MSPSLLLRCPRRVCAYPSLSPSHSLCPWATWSTPALIFGGVESSLALGCFTHCLAVRAVWDVVIPEPLLIVRQEGVSASGIAPAV